MLNDCLRWLISNGARFLGLLLTLILQLQLRGFSRRQHGLRLKYRVTDQTPILSYGPEVERLIESAAKNARDEAKFAATSGSTGIPKRILFTKRRLQLLKLTFSDFFLRCCWAFSIRRTSLYVFSSMTSDDSLTSMLLDERRLTSYFSTLQAPYRIQCHPAITSLASAYGTTAVRLWILTIANPGVLYSTNPSTLSTFLDDLANNWNVSSQLIRDWHNTPKRFDRSIHRIAHRLEGRRTSERLAAVATSEKPLSLENCAPAVSTYICWTGGYVQPFLTRIEKHLPSHRYRLIPMYSMSTETVETTCYIRKSSVAFVPCAPGVLYEFIAEHDEDLPLNILKADQLEVGRAYSLVVSDPYGLRRYQTNDLFLCAAKVNGLPDLRFLRRRGLEYSFTGEKLTEQQVSSALSELRVRFKADEFLTCIPSHPLDEAIPHYKLVIVGENSNGCNSREEISAACDCLLAQINCEYRNKRETGRLGRIRVVRMTQNDFVRKIKASSANNWEAQFKFMPLYCQTWESSIDEAVKHNLESRVG